MNVTLKRSWRRGTAGSAAVLIAGASMWLSSAPTLANGHTTSSSQTNGSSNHNGAGDNNRGDVWTDNVAQPSGPGHEQDPHLTCTDINLWAAGMGDSSGSYAIDSWPPSGNQAVVYNSTWLYNRAQTDPQVISVIDVQKLVASARAAGAAPQNKQGYHFKLDLTQDPQKHKTFWVNCETPTSGGSPTPGHSASPTPGHSASPTPSNGASATPSNGTSPTPTAGVQGVSTTPSPSVAAGASPAQGTLGAGTTMPSTGQAALTVGLLVALALIIAGAAALRRSRTTS
jgi:hypothetical protein